jgi:hypothetical protein
MKFYIAISFRFINNKTTVADVKEKEEARRLYDAARAVGQSAGHVEQS